VDLSQSEKGRRLLAELEAFMTERVYPAEAVYAQQRAAAGLTDHAVPPIIFELMAEARSRGLWNLFLPAVSGLSNLDYAPIAELTGRSPYLAPVALNCNAPDTGNMELLHLFGTDEQKRTWLEPLLAGEIRSGFSMTEPDVASSDARNIATSIVRDGDDYVINGRKWWTTGAADPRCELLIVMGKTDPDAPTHQQQSMILVPARHPGVEIVRSLPLFGYHDQQGHCEIHYRDVRVPAGNLLGERGGGFAIAQARLGPGRIHHAMRCIGMAERALDEMTRRSLAREAFGGPLADQGVVQAQIAESRIEIEQARLLILKTAWLIDRGGAKNARSEVAAIKVIGPRVAENVLDRAIQIHGGKGISDDLLLARMWASARALRIADGPDEVHVRTVARRELARHR
jgi:acyl-CoA dehydrogenase